MTGETNTDDLSPAPDAWSRPDIPLHAKVALPSATESQAKRLRRFQGKASGAPVAFGESISYLHQLLSRWCTVRCSLFSSGAARVAADAFFLGFVFVFARYVIFSVCIFTELRKVMSRFNDKNYFSKMSTIFFVPSQIAALFSLQLGRRTEMVRHHISAIAICSNSDSNSERSARSAS